MTITQILIINLNIFFFYLGLNLELGNTLKQEYEELWNTVLTLSEEDDFGGSMPVRTTSRPFLTQKETSPRGADKFETLISSRTEKDEQYNPCLENKPDLLKSCFFAGLVLLISFHTCTPSLPPHCSFYFFACLFICLFIYCEVMRKRADFY